MTIPELPIPEIRVVLDRSALQSYAEGYVDVGELIREVADEKHLGQNVAVGIPAAALAEAYADNVGNTHHQDLLGVIPTLPGTLVLNLDRAAAVSMGGVVRLTNGDISRAHSVWAAIKHRALLFTSEPVEVKSLIPPGRVIVIPAEYT